ncbi:hypothetical protein EV421DRAFT_1901439 [Armillaria borealis]|uniref:Uncharacterized protein n=1 Tax=Armillaria borealis TaxID=47425 RepID=A0AA39JRT5_9AGAR|nr:hypothetical protein EV421DRAFT_1901439 [Armillaria borealis]
MVNWKDATIIAEQYLGVAKVTHFCAGVFLWEFLSTMDYEFTIYTRKRPFRWTLIIYLLTRYATLGAMLCYLIGFNDRIEFDCKAWLETTYAHHETAWDLASRTCIAKNTAENALNCITTFVTDFVLLLSMLSGILRTKNDQSLWRLLYRQGVVWTALATVAEVPELVRYFSSAALLVDTKLPWKIFLNLNLNDPMNLMFQPVAMTILNIAATRLYRDLALSASPNSMP